MRKTAAVISCCIIRKPEFKPANWQIFKAAQCAALFFAALLLGAASVAWSQNWNNNMNVMLAAFGLGGWEVLLIFAVVLILFGAKKLPDLAKGLGTGIKEFKKATREVTEEIQNAPVDTHQPKLTTATQSQPPATVSHTTTPPKA